MKLFLLFCLFPLSLQLFPGAIPDEGDYRHLYPIVCLAIRSYEAYEEYSLPYVMGLIEELKYPKDRMHISFFKLENDLLGVKLLDK